MHIYEEVKDMLCDELEKIAQKGELTAGSLDIVDKLTHSIKSLETIIPTVMMTGTQIATMTADTTPDTLIVAVVIRWADIPAGAADIAVPRLTKRSSKNCAT